MKNSVKTIFTAIVAVVMFNSCSKEKEDPTPDKLEKKVAVELSYNGDAEFAAGLSLKIFGEDVSNTKVNGMDWEDVVVDENKHGAQFLGEVEVSGEALKTVRLETSTPVWGCTAITTFGPDHAELETPVSVTVKYFIEDKLVKTDEFTLSVENFYTYNQELLIADYE